MSTASISMVAGNQKTRKKLLQPSDTTRGMENRPITDNNEALTAKNISTTKEEAAQARDGVTDKAEANHYIACIIENCRFCG
jgi:hypothetical protein